MSPDPTCGRRTTPAPDLADGLQVVLDPDAPPGDVLPALARLLRRLRDRAQAEARGAVDGGAPASAN